MRNPTKSRGYNFYNQNKKMQRSNSSLLKRKEGKPNTLSEFTPEAINFITKILQDRDYEIVERLGLGGFSMIFKVKSTRNNQFFAAKVICVGSARHANCFLTYKNEKKALSRIYHANIIKLTEAFESGKFCFMILELCGDKTLNDIIKAGTATVMEKISYMRQLLHAIIHVHSCGYAHRDIKPANVLFDDFGRVKLADFGMCIKFRLGQKSSEYLGSPHYMAPEIYRRQPFDPFAADIWALGVTFYLLCGGKVNWPSSIDMVSRMIREEGLVVHRGLSPDVSQMVLQMTRMEPEERPSLAEILKTPIFNTKMEISRSFSRTSPSNSKNLIKNMPTHIKHSSNNLLSLAASHQTPRRNSKRRSQSSTSSKSKNSHQRSQSISSSQAMFQQTKHQQSSHRMNSPHSNAHSNNSNPQKVKANHKRQRSVAPVHPALQLT